MKQVETLAAIGIDAAHNNPDVESVDMKKMLTDLHEVVDATRVL